MAKKSAVIVVQAEGTDKFNSQMNKSADSVRKFGQKADMSVAGIAKMAGAIGAVKVALDVVKDAFFKSETNLDEWGRTVNATKSVYTSFLNTLNGGSISDFLSNIDNIVRASRDAYDALDELATNNAFMQRSNARYQSEYDKALEAYKLDPSGENKQKVIDANKQIVDELTRQATESSSAYDKELSRLARERGLSAENEAAFVDLFKNGTANQLKALKHGYSTGTGLNFGAQYWNGNQVQGDELLIRNRGGVVVERRAMTAAEKEQFEMAKALSQINDTEIDQVQKLGAETYQLESAIANQNRAMERQIGLTKQATADAKKLESATRSAAERITETGGIDIYLGKKSGKRSISGAMLGNSLSAQAGRGSSKTVNEVALEGIGVESTFSSGTSYVEETTAALKEQENVVALLGNAYATLGDVIGDSAGSVVKSLGSMLQAIGALIPAMEAASMAEGTETATRSSHHWVETLSAIAAVTAGVMSVFSNLPKFETGGVVGGSSYSGDKLLARVNSGEGILTAQGMKNLNSMLSSSQNGGNVKFEIEGRKLVGVLNNYQYNRSSLL